MDPNQPRLDRDQNQQNQPSMPQPQAQTAPPSPPVPPTGTIPPSPVTPGQTQDPLDGPKSNGKIILFFVIGILLLIVLGIIYFMATQLRSQSKTEALPTPTQVPTPTLTPTPTPLSEEDIDKIDLGDPATDLESIEEDLNQL